ncbi:MAG: hypothetical protein K2N63_03175 [Lachnospiraceae bacterium]|nr:hypothetical protein [Lachnospiraceae bacterium]
MNDIALKTFRFFDLGNKLSEKTEPERNEKTLKDTIQTALKQMEEENMWLLLKKKVLPQNVLKNIDLHFLEKQF